MSQPTNPLWNAILTNPEDEVAHLVYADWLVEHNDPLGEFIHIQCRLEHVRPWEEGWTQLRGKAEEFLLLHEETWSAKVQPFLDPRWRLSGNSSRAVFSRGLPEVVCLTAQHFLSCHQDLFASAPIRCLILKDCNSLISKVL